MRRHVRGAALGLVLAALVGCGSPGGDDNGAQQDEQANRSVEKPSLCGENCPYLVGVSSASPITFEVELRERRMFW